MILVSAHYSRDDGLLTYLPLYVISPISTTLPVSTSVARQVNGNHLIQLKPHSAFSTTSTGRFCSGLQGQADTARKEAYFRFSIIMQIKMQGRVKFYGLHMSDE